MNATVDAKGRITAASNGTGGGGSLPTDYISSGLIISYVSTTEVECGTGTAYNPNASAAQTVSSTITSNYSYSSQTDLTIDATNNKKVSSASHPFTANDIGSTVDVTAGTSWTTGNYIVLTVDGSGNAYLNKSPSAAGNSNHGTYTLKLTASVLYGIFLASATSIVIQGPIQLVDLAIDGSNNLLVSSASFTFTTAMVGQYINVTAGTSWTAGYYQIASISSGKAVLATSPSSAGNANLATASMSMIPYSGSTGNYQGTASQSIDGNTYRYLGTVLTGSSNTFYNFVQNPNGTYYYQTYTGPATPFYNMNSSASSSTTYSLASVLPPTAYNAQMQINSSSYLYLGVSTGYVPTVGGGQMAVQSSSYNFVPNVAVNKVQAFLYNGGASTWTYYLSGYSFNR
jgi:hypothetical protein